MNAIRTSFWANSLFYTFLQKFSLFILNALTYILIIRAFVPQVFAYWALYIMIFSIVDSLKLSLLRNITIKFYHDPEYKEEEQSVSSASFKINAGMTLLVLLVLLPGAKFFADILHSPGLENLIYASVPVFIFQVFLHQGEIYFQYKYKFDVLLYATFIRQVIFFISVVCMIWSFRENLSLIALVLLQGFSFFICFLYLFKVDKRFLMYSPTNEKALIKKMLGFGKYIFGTNLAAQISRNLDHMLTAAILPGTEGRHYVALYNSINRISNFTDMPSHAVADVLYPKNAESFSVTGIEGVKANLEKMLGAILAILIPVSLVIFLFPKAVIYIIAGKSYYDAVPLLQLTIFFMMYRPLSYQFGSTLVAIGKPRLNFYADLFLLAVNAVAMFSFLKTYGGKGAAYAIMVTGGITLITMYVILKTTVGISLKNILRAIPDTYRRIPAMIKSKKKPDGFNKED